MLQQTTTVLFPRSTIRSIEWLWAYGGLQQSVAEEIPLAGITVFALPYAIPVPSAFRYLRYPFIPVAKLAVDTAYVEGEVDSHCLDSELKI